jgi:hypothetical protein
MTFVIDPLKMRALGVKKPLEEKKEKIEGLQDEFKRYYPVDKHGQLDEWGAVIKHQAETYEKEMQDKQMMKAQLQQLYSNDLANQIKYKQLN